MLNFTEPESERHTMNATQHWSRGDRGVYVVFQQIMTAVVALVYRNIVIGMGSNCLYVEGNHIRLPYRIKAETKYAFPWG